MKNMQDGMTDKVEKNKNCVVSRAFVEKYFLPVENSVPTTNDLQWLRLYFGRKILEPQSVVRRNLFGLPSVVRMPLLRNKSPFPTLYWLTDPDMSRKVGSLEALGSVKTFEIRIKQNISAMQLYLSQHARYASSRWELASESERKILQENGFHEKLKHVGIGGIRELYTVKCLHLHMAHLLATGDNIIGEWIVELLLEEVYCA
jgi:uncharacterized protein